MLSAALGVTSTPSSDDANILKGMIGLDRLEGSGGDDRLTGGRDSDTFVFKPGFGRDTITDFAASGSYSLIGPDHDVLESGTGNKLANHLTGY